MSFQPSVPSIHVGCSDFEFERSGNTIVGLKFVIARLLAMLV
jgi:hypothetical protein